MCVIAGAIIGAIAGGIAGNAYADSCGYTGSEKAEWIVAGALGGSIAGAAIGYIAAPAVVSLTGVAGVSITAEAGMTAIPAYLTGQLHHVLSNRIMMALENHPLKGLFSRAASVIQALTEEAHLGYQQWHRYIDNDMTDWLLKHPNASPYEFWNKLYSLYNTKDMIRRFGEAVLDYIKQQMQQWR